ncbi:hypothetical protein EYC59_05475 [Candidatus Saccharibacteria bacterium]|nr:MAG: hypothetical protein EYC59_05475 [Candidatus Saccharibacteria bacterium]
MAAPKSRAQKTVVTKLSSFAKLHQLGLAVFANMVACIAALFGFSTVFLAFAYDVERQNPNLQQSIAQHVSAASLIALIPFSIMALVCVIVSVVNLYVKKPFLTKICFIVAITTTVLGIVAFVAGPLSIPPAK